MHNTGARNRIRFPFETWRPISKQLVKTKQSNVYVLSKDCLNKKTSATILIRTSLKEDAPHGVVWKSPPLFPVLILIHFVFQDCPQIFRKKAAGLTDLDRHSS